MTDDEMVRLKEAREYMERALRNAAIRADRLHPESMRTLEQLVKLHGADRCIRAIHQIEDNLRKAPKLSGG